MVDAAINRIANGVLGMPFVIKPPSDLRENEEAQEIADWLQQSLRIPNHTLTHNSWRKMTWALMEDMICHGYAFVERHGEENNRLIPNDLSREVYAFTLYPGNASQIRINASYDPDDEESPAYLDYSLTHTGKPPEEIPRRHGFLIQPRTISYSLKPPSPLEVAYDYCQIWLGLTETQSNATSSVKPRSLIYLTGADGEPIEKRDLEQFRHYWELSVEQENKTPVIGNQVGVLPLNASDDSGLYLQFSEYIMRIVAIAFSVSARDYNLNEHDNRATADASADSTWQNAVLPFAKALFEHFNDEVITYYYPGYTLEFVDKEPRGEEAEANTAALLFEKGIITRNSALLRIGEQPIGVSGDVFSTGERLNEENEIVPVEVEEVQQPDAQDDKQGESDMVEATKRKATKRKDKTTKQQLSIF